MTSNKFIFFILFVLTTRTSSGQQLSSEKLDTTISIFWNPNLKLRIQILNPEETDTQKKNAVLTLFPFDRGPHHILYIDSIFVNILLLKITDIDGDGIQDLLVFNTNNGPQNKNYHLYLVNQKLGGLTRVKKFEKIFNPSYDQSHCLLIGYESYEQKLIINRYIVHKNGTWGIVGW